jgi:hypothetical protein
MRGETRKKSEKPEVCPLRYTQTFLVKFDEVAAPISSTAAEDTFEASSRKRQQQPTMDLLATVL